MTTDRTHPGVFLPLAATTVLAGLAAGFFFAYSANVVLALDRLPADAYTGIMQPINDTVLNPAFNAVFFGTTLVGAVGVVAIHLWGDLRSRYGAIFVGGFLLYLVGIVFLTRLVHVPTNDYIATWSQASPPADWAAVRDRWARWNLVRTAVSTVSFVLSLAATLSLVADEG